MKFGSEEKGVNPLRGPGLDELSRFVPILYSAELDEFEDGLDELTYSVTTMGSEGTRRFRRMNRRVESISSVDFDFN